MTIQGHGLIFQKKFYTAILVYWIQPHKITIHTFYIVMVVGYYHLTFS